jgi:hypothetical protein
VHGTIDITHIGIPKPFGAIATNYYYHNSKGAFSGVAIVIDLNKHLYVLIGFSRSVNDLLAFRWFSLYQKVQYNGLFSSQLVPCENNNPMYFLDDKEYLLFMDLMVNVINPRKLLERLSCITRS